MDRYRAILGLLLLLPLLSLIHGQPLAGASVPKRTEALPSRVYYESQAELQWLADQGFDIWGVNRQEGFATILLTPAARERLAAIGYRVVTQRPRTAHPAVTGSLAFYGGYKGVEELYSLYDQLATSYPEIVEVVTYGESWDRITPDGAAGYELRALRITNRQIEGTVPAPGLPDQPDIQISKPVFLLMAAIHAREISTPELALRFAHYLADGYGQDADVTWLVDHHEIWVIPVANPDGYRIVESGGESPIYHRKNTNSTGSDCSSQDNYAFWHPGIDLNRNASFKWNMGGSSAEPCSQTYRGPSPASEPEQQALEKLMAALYNDQRGPEDDEAAPASSSGVLISLHSFSDLVLWPWGWTASDHAPNDAQLAQLGNKMASYNGYFAGQAGADLYVASGTTDDWAYGTLGVAAYTFEVGPDPWADGVCGGFFPAYSCQERFWELNRPALLYAAKSARAPYLVPAGPDVLAPSVCRSRGTGSEIMRITAEVDDWDNGGNPISAASYWIDQPDWAAGAAHPMAPVDGAFDSPIEQVSVELEVAALSPGRHLLFLRGQDEAGNRGPATALFLDTSEPLPACDHTLYFPVMGR